MYVIVIHNEDAFIPDLATRKREQFCVISIDPNLLIELLKPLDQVKRFQPNKYEILKTAILNQRVYYAIEQALAVWHKLAYEQPLITVDYTTGK